MHGGRARPGAAGLATAARSATGRDAADTAFMSTYGGAVELTGTQVTATIEGPLPADDVNALVSIS